jgi:D-sedoheptulose 7-phosphate isomerase
MNQQVHKELDHLLENYPQLAVCTDDIWNAFTLMTDGFRRGGLIMTCGNGGSAADAEHITGELMKSFKQRRPVSDEQRAALEAAFPNEGAYLADHLQRGIPCISLVSQVSLMTAFANDVAADMAFAQQVFVYGCPGDVLIGLSTSGNSKNVVNACATAKASGMKTIGMTGEQGGKLREICDVTICVPASETYRVQEYHLPVYHALCAMMECSFFY